MPPIHDHEKLNVSQRSLEFVQYSEDVLSILSTGLGAWGLLDRASTSIPLKIAEGKGRYRPKDRSRFFEIACGSALGDAAFRDLVCRLGQLKSDRGEEGTSILFEIVSMLVGLIKSQNSDRLYEAPGGDHSEAHGFD